VSKPYGDINPFTHHVGHSVEQKQANSRFGISLQETLHHWNDLKIPSPRELLIGLIKPIMGRKPFGNPLAP
jgi:hypothetical protein